MKHEKFKWKCKRCKSSNYVKREVIARHLGDLDRITTDTAIIELPCGRCHDKNLVEVSGLLSTGMWELRPTKLKDLTGPRAVVSKDVDTSLDEVRLLMAQGRVAPWSDIGKKETILIYQVYVEDGDIKTRLRTSMLTDPLMQEVYGVLEKNISAAYLDTIKKDLALYEKRVVSGGDVCGN